METFSRHHTVPIASCSDFIHVPAHQIGISVDFTIFISHTRTSPWERKKAVTCKSQDGCTSICDITLMFK